MNVLNVSDIETQLDRLASHVIYPTCRQWLKRVARNHLLGTSLSEKDAACNFFVYTPDKPAVGMPQRNALPAWPKKALKDKQVLHWFDPFQVRRRSLWQALENIVNWFNSWPETDTRIPRVDRMCFDVAAAAAGMWMGKISTNLWDYVKDKPPIIKSYDNGFHWVRLVTALHFEREGAKMGHCIGNGNYHSMFKRGDAEFYSLRDGRNEPHCSVELSVHGKERTVRQCKGKSNQKPGPKYQPYIRKFFNDMHWRIDGDTGYID